jgi:hypothetical protein
MRLGTKRLFPAIQRTEGVSTVAARHLERLLGR